MTPRTGASHYGIMIGPGELFNGELFNAPSSVGGLPLLKQRNLASGAIKNCDCRPVVCLRLRQCT